MKSLFKSVAILTLFSFITRIAGFFFRIYLSRTIGTEQLGLYQIVFSVFIVIVTIVTSGLPLTVSKLTAKYNAEEKKENVYKMTSAALVIGCIAASITSLIILLFNKHLNFLFTDSRCMHILIILLPSTIFSAVYSILRGVIWGNNKYLAVSFIEFGEQIVRIIICMFILSFFLKASEGAIATGQSLVIATLFSMIALIVLYFKTGHKLSSPKGFYKEVLASSLPITGVRIASSLIQPLIAIILPMRMVSAGFTNEYALSQFGVAMGMTFPLLFLPTTLIGSLSLALIPDLASAVAVNDTKHVNNRAKNAIIFSFFISSLCVPAFLALGKPICELLYNNTQAGIYLQNSAILMIPFSISNITSSILNSLGLEVKSFKNYLIGAIFLLISIWFLPKYIGINSLIIGMGLCTTLPCILGIKKINQTTKSRENYLKPILLLLVLILPCYILTKNIYTLTLNIFPSFIALCLSGIVSVASYLVLCEIFNVVKIKTLIKFKSKPKKCFEG